MPGTALVPMRSTTLNPSTALGHRVLRSICTSCTSTALGHRVLRSICTSCTSTALGHRVLRSICTSLCVIAITPLRGEAEAI